MTGKNSSNVKHTLDLNQVSTGCLENLDKPGGLLTGIIVWSTTKQIEHA